MSMIIGMLLLACAIVWASVFSGYCAIKGLMNGRFVSPFWTAERSRNGVLFWLVFFCYAALSITLAVTLVDSFT